MYVYQATVGNSNIVSVYTSVSGILVVLVGVREMFVSVRMWRKGCGHDSKRRGWVVNVAVHEEEAMVAVPLS